MHTSISVVFWATGLSFAAREDKDRFPTFSESEHPNYGVTLAEEGD